MSKLIHINPSFNIFSKDKYINMSNFDGLKIKKTIHNQKPIFTLCAYRGTEFCADPTTPLEYLCSIYESENYEDLCNMFSEILLKTAGAPGDRYTSINIEELDSFKAMQINHKPSPVASSSDITLREIIDNPNFDCNCIISLRNTDDGTTCRLDSNKADAISDEIMSRTVKYITVCNNELAIEV